MSQYGDHEQPRDPYGGAGAPATNPYHPGEPAVVEKPKQVRLAVTLIWTGIALGALSTILSFVFLDDLIDAALEQQPGTSSVDRGTIESIVVVTIVFTLVISVAISAVFAVFIGKGHNWARIVYTVLSVLGLVFGLTGIGNQPAAIVALSAVGWLLTAAVLVLLYQRDANAYFSQRRR